MYPSEIRHLRRVRLVHALAVAGAFFVIPFFGHLAPVFPLFACFVVLFVPRWNEARVIAPLWLLMVGSVFLPFDIGLAVLPGRPRFVRRLGGTPNREGQAAIRRGEAIMGSCMKTRFTPNRVWVW